MSYRYQLSADRRKRDTIFPPMAMEMTHVRFALELIPQLAIVDRAAYFSGAVYPDSRYYTHIEREKTHGDHVPADPFHAGLSDFQKGWATHIFYDRCNKQPINDLSPIDLGPLSLNSPSHVFHTCVKVIEDQNSYDMTDHSSTIFSTMKIPAAPSGEDQGKLEHYYQILSDLYNNKPGIENYLRYFAAWGCPQDGLDAIAACYHSLIPQANLINGITRLFPTTLAIALQARNR